MEGRSAGRDQWGAGEVVVAVEGDRGEGAPDELLGATPLPP